MYISRPGITSAAGLTSPALWQAICKADNSCMKKTSTFNSKEYIAARIPDSSLSASNAEFDMKVIRIENAALSQIDSVIEKALSKYGKERIAVCVGTCDNGSEFSLAGHRVYFEKGAFDKEYTIEMQGADYVATFVSKKYDIKGPSLAFTTACSSSAAAALKAKELISAGFADAAIVGGVDIASDTTLLGFDSLGAVSAQATNPFSKNRSGITLGDGAAFFVLSRDFIDRDFAKIKLSGFGMSSDAYHITSPNPTGEGAAKAMQDAIEDAGLRAEEIGYVNLHGTGTLFNDAMEAKALSKVFASYPVPASSTKSITGHTLGAASALETSICALALKEGLLPPQKWDGIYDTELPAVNIVSTCEKVLNLKNILTSSFAFGGANFAEVLSLEED